MDAATRRLVEVRAGLYCEYCRLPQRALLFARFHIEHIRARQHGGTDHPDNLALACGHCNRHKGPNLAAFDPQTDAVVPLFNPRRQSHREHFARDGATIRGLTSTGRATVELLQMNSARQLELRADWHF